MDQISNFDFRWISTYKKQIACGICVVAFAGLVHRLRNTRHLLKLEELMQKSPQHAELSPYIYAGKAFAYSTSLVGLGTTVIGLSVASYMSADSLDEFRIKMRAWTAKTFPKLQVYREMGDTGEQEFADEWDREARKKDWEENAPHAYIGHLIRSNLGPLSRKPEA